MTASGEPEHSQARFYRRAASAAGMPLAVHREGESEQSESLQWSEGSCAACHYVNGLPAGQQACRADRQRAAATARKLGQPISFVCHMGFGCTVLAPKSGADLYITLGPWCPQGMDQALAFDACRGLARLKKLPSLEEFPTSLDDIHRCPPGVAEAVLDWLQSDIEGASALIAAQSPENEAAFPEDPKTLSGSAKTSPGARGTDHTAVVVAAALAGNRVQVREALEASLAENRASRRASRAEKYLHLLGVVYQVLSVLESRGVDTASIRANGWPSPSVPENDETFRAAVLSLSRSLCRVVPKAGKPLADTPAAPRKSYPELDALLRNRLADPPELREVARALGKSSAAITRQLQRDIGISYTGYVGRLRIESAKELLRRTKLPIDAVARRMGYSDSSNFRRSFKQFAGMGPSAYREQYGKK